MTERNSTERQDTATVTTEYFDQPPFMAPELTQDLLKAGYGEAFGQAQRLGDVHHGLHCIAGLARLAERFEVEADCARNDPEAGPGRCISPHMANLLLSSVQLIATHLASETASFSAQLVEDVKKNRAPAGADFDARR